MNNVLAIPGGIIEVVERRQEATTLLVALCGDCNVADISSTRPKVKVTSCLYDRTKEIDNLLEDEFFFES
jgi:hypothetical protein